MTNAQALSFDDVDPARRHIEQQIDEMIFEQIHFIDVEKTPVGSSEQTGGEGLHAIHQGALDIHRSDDTIFCGAEWQIDDGHRFRHGLERATRRPPAMRAGLRQGLRIAIERTACDELQRGQ